MRFEGQQIGRYYFKQFIGTGGTGDVYLAEDPRIHQQVAIKVIQGGDLTFPPAKQMNDLEQFRQEAAAIANLNHPHIVHLNDYNEAQVNETKITYIVTPFYKAGSLAQWLRSRGSNPLPLRDIADIVRQAADALEYTHQHHIIHQDVKPANFLIDNEENLQSPNLLLTDFGISKFNDTTSFAGTSPSVGTLTYMAPEQINGRPTFASDQYALAIMAYELLTGRPPFQGPPQVVMNQHFNAQPQPPSALNPALPKAIDSVILRALAKKPADRFDSIAAFATAFQQSLQKSGHFTEAPPPPPKDKGNTAPQRGKDIYQPISISQAEAQRGTTRVLALGGRQVQIPVPANAFHGQVIRLQGQGEPSHTGGPAGDLYVTINVAAEIPVPPPPPGPMGVSPNAAPGQNIYDQRAYAQPAQGPGYVAPPPPQGYMTPRVQKSRRGLWITLSVIGGVLLLSCIVASVYSITNSQNAQGISLTLGTYCNALRGGDDATAYNLLASNLTNQVGTEAQFAREEQTFIQSNGINSCSFNTTDVNGSNDSGAIVYNSSSGQSLTVIYTLENDGGVWKITSRSQPI